MIRSLLNLALGYRTVLIAKESVSSALNLLREEGYIHWCMNTEPQGSLSFCITEHDADAFLNACEAGKIEIQSVIPHGFPHFVHRYAG